MILNMSSLMKDVEDLMNANPSYYGLLRSNLQQFLFKSIWKDLINFYKDYSKNCTSSIATSNEQIVLLQYFPNLKKHLGSSLGWSNYHFDLNNHLNNPAILLFTNKSSLSTEEEILLIKRACPDLNNRDITRGMRYDTIFLSISDQVHIEKKTFFSLYDVVGLLLFSSYLQETLSSIGDSENLSKLRSILSKDRTASAEAWQSKRSKTKSQYAKSVAQKFSFSEQKFLREEILKTFINKTTAFNFFNKYSGNYLEVGFKSKSKYPNKFLDLLHPNFPSDCAASYLNKITKETIDYSGVKLYNAGLELLGEELNEMLRISPLPLARRFYLLNNRDRASLALGAFDENGKVRLAAETLLQKNIKSKKES